MRSRIDFDKYRELNRRGLAEFHTHTTYCDGKMSAEEMLRDAAAKGVKVYGFSGHGYTEFDEGYCMLPEQLDAYEKEVRELAAKYSSPAQTDNPGQTDSPGQTDNPGQTGSPDQTGGVKVLCGVEQDCLAGKPDRDWDYVIGSVHYIDCSDLAAGDHMYSTCCKPNIVTIDETPEMLLDAADRYFGGDLYALIERFYETAARVWEATGADIIGHFDLIAKFNRGGELGGPDNSTTGSPDRAGSQKQTTDQGSPDKADTAGALFDENHPRYVAAWQAAADKLLQAGVPFEINTGGISRGYRTDAYPAKPIRDYLREHGARFILSSDSHTSETFGFKFDEYEI